MLEILTDAQLLCDASACSYDSVSTPPVITLLDCSLWKGQYKDTFMLEGKPVLIVKHVVCRYV